MKRSKPTIRFTFAFALCFTVVATAAAIIVVSNQGATQLALHHGDALMGEVADHTQDRVQGYLNPVAHHVEILTLGGLDSLQMEGGLDAVEERLFPVSVAAPTISMLNMGFPDGRFVMVKHMADGSRATKRFSPEEYQGAEWRYRKPGGAIEEVERVERDSEDDYDPTSRPWYQGALKTQDASWSEAYIFWTDQRPGITVSRALRNGGEVIGVVSADVDIIQFSEQLAEVELTPGTEILVLDEDMRIVASPRPQDLVVSKDGGYHLRGVAESTLPQVSILAEESQARHSLEAGGERNFRYQVNGEEFLAVARPLHLAPNRNWTIVVIVPEAELLARVKDINTWSITLSVGLLLFALLLSLVLARVFNTAIRKLARESERIRDLDFTAGTREQARFREIEEVQEAFEGMKVGLRSFQKYLPVELVRVLLANRIEPVLGGDPREVTIFFSDIAGFTPISEQLEPMEMSRRLGRYLAALTKEIESRGGTVVQYVGDAIMAFWNAPLDVEDHAFAACEAALACQAVVPTLWPEEEAPIFHTRIGLHTATVAVGHFGSPDRLYYGAIGDGVNLAARIEGANKVFKTSIALSQSCAERVKERLRVRKLDQVLLVGSEQVTTLFELVGEEALSPTPKTCAKYEEALEAYFDGHFETALELLSEVREVDKASEALASRCSVLLHEPPGDAWRGVWVAKSK